MIDYLCCKSCELHTHQYVWIVLKGVTILFWEIISLPLTTCHILDTNFENNDEKLLKTTIKPWPQILLVSSFRCSMIKIFTCWKLSFFFFFFRNTYMYYDFQPNCELFFFYRSTVFFSLFHCDYEFFNKCCYHFISRKEKIVMNVM